MQRMVFWYKILFFCCLPKPFLIYSLCVTMKQGSFLAHGGETPWYCCCCSYSFCSPFQIERCQTVKLFVGEQWWKRLLGGNKMESGTLLSAGSLLWYSCNIEFLQSSGMAKRTTKMVSGHFLQVLFFFFFLLIDDSDSISYCVTDSSRTYNIEQIEWNARPFLGMKKKKNERYFTSLESRIPCWKSRTSSSLVSSLSLQGNGIQEMLLLQYQLQIVQQAISILDSREIMLCACWWQEYLQSLEFCSRQYVQRAASEPRKDRHGPVCAPPTLLQQQKRRGSTQYNKTPTTLFPIIRDRPNPFHRRLVSPYTVEGVVLLESSHP